MKKPRRGKPQETQGQKSQRAYGEETKKGNNSSVMFRFMITPRNIYQYARIRYPKRAPSKQIRTWKNMDYND